MTIDSLRSALQVVASGAQKENALLSHLSSLGREDKERVHSAFESALGGTRQAVFLLGDSVDMRHGSSAGLAIANGAVFECEEREVPAEAHVRAWVDLRADLANEDRAGRNFLAAEHLRAASLAVGITTVSRTTLSLFM